MKKKNISIIVAFSLVVALLAGITTQYFTYKNNVETQFDLMHYQLQSEQDAVKDLAIEKLNLEKTNLALVKSLEEMKIKQQELAKELASRGTNTTTSSFVISDKEFYLFTCIVAREASPQGNYADNYEAALDVATVIMNRLPYWGGTITSVVSAHTHNKDGSITWQFSTYLNYTQCTPQDYEIQACKDALNGARSLPKTTLFFCTPESYDKSSFFQSLIVVTRRHGHVFCRNS